MLLLGASSPRDLDSSLHGLTVGRLEDMKAGFLLVKRAKRAREKMLPCVYRSEADAECLLLPRSTLSLMIEHLTEPCCFG